MVIEREEHEVEKGIEITVWFEGEKERHKMKLTGFTFLKKDGKVVGMEDKYKCIQ